MPKGSQKYAPIQDERLVKRPVTAYIQFSINRNASGDFRNISLGERAKLIGQEWRALNESEKKVRLSLTNSARASTLWKGVVDADLNHRNTRTSNTKIKVDISASTTMCSAILLRLWLPRRNVTYGIA